jgi:TrmH family RNA methyltransferase
MRAKVIIVGPKYQVNLGYIARTAANFGVGRLFFVSPRANLTGKTALMYAKHARTLLEKATVYRSLDAAVRDCDVVVATSGIWRKGKSGSGRVFLAEDAMDRVSRLRKNSVVGLVIGRDDTGLRREEIEKCDMLAYIATDPRYPVLNISHALAVLLYLLKRKGLGVGYRGVSPGGGELDKRELAVLFKVFDGLVAGKRIRDRSSVSNAFRRMVRAAQPTESELHSLITALK